MRILYVGRNARIGGGSTFRLNVGRGMQERGHQTWLAAWPGEVLPRYRAAGIGYVWTPPPPWGGPWILRALRRQQIDLVHASNPSPGMAAQWACRRAGVPLVISIHGLLSTRHRDKSCLQTARRIITFEDAAVSHLKRVFPNEVDPTKIVHVRRPIVHEPRQPAEEGGFRIVHIGRVSKRKGVNALECIKAFAEFRQQAPNSRLDILGDGTLLGEVRQAAEAYNQSQGEEAIGVHGSVPDPLPLVGSAHVVIGAGYCALEALMQGIAVIGAGFRGYGVITRENVLHAMKTNSGDSNFRPEGPPWEITAANFLAALRRLHAAWQSGDEVQRRQYWRLDEELAPLHSVDAVCAHLEGIYSEVLGLPAASDSAQSSS